MNETLNLFTHCGNLDFHSGKCSLRNTFISRRYFYIIFNLGFHIISLSMTVRIGTFLVSFLQEGFELNNIIQHIFFIQPWSSNRSYYLSAYASGISIKHYTFYCLF